MSDNSAAHETDHHTFSFHPPLIAPESKL